MIRKSSVYTVYENWIVLSFWWCMWHTVLQVGWTSIIWHVIMGHRNSHSIVQHCGGNFFNPSTNIINIMLSLFYDFKQRNFRPMVYYLIRLKDFVFSVGYCYRQRLQKYRRRSADGFAGVNVNWLVSQNNVLSIVMHPTSPLGNQDSELRVVLLHSVYKV